MPPPNRTKESICLRLASKSLGMSHERQRRFGIHLGQGAGGEPRGSQWNVHLREERVYCKKWVYWVGDWDTNRVYNPTGPFQNGLPSFESGTASIGPQTGRFGPGHGVRLWGAHIPELHSRFAFISSLTVEARKVPISHPTANQHPSTPESFPISLPPPL